MTTASRSRALAARQRVEAAHKARMDQETEAVEGVLAAVDQRAQAQLAMEVADQEFRTQVAALVDLGHSTESVAELCGVPLQLVRAARRPKSGEAAGTTERMTLGGTGKRRQLAVTPPPDGDTQPAGSPADDGVDAAVAS